MMTRSLWSFACAHDMTLPVERPENENINQYTQRVYIKRSRYVYISVYSLEQRFISCGVVVGTMHFICECADCFAGGADEFIQLLKNKQFVDIFHKQYVHAQVWKHLITFSLRINCVTHYIYFKTRIQMVFARR